MSHELACSGMPPGHMAISLCPSRLAAPTNGPGMATGRIPGLTCYSSRTIETALCGHKSTNDLRKHHPRLTRECRQSNRYTCQDCTGDVEPPQPPPSRTQLPQQGVVHNTTSLRSKLVVKEARHARQSCERWHDTPQQHPRPTTAKPKSTSTARKLLFPLLCSMMFSFLRSRWRYKQEELLIALIPSAISYNHEKAWW